MPDVGVAGQERILAATVAIVGDDLACRTACWYLAAAGVGTLRLIRRAPKQDNDGWGTTPLLPAKVLQHRPWPAGSTEWLEALEGCNAVMRSGFDQDGLLGVASRLGIPLVVARSRDDLVDVVCFAGTRDDRQPLADEPELREEGARADRADPTPTAGEVVAGTIAVSEILLLLAGVAGRPAPGARHLHVPLDGRDLAAQNIPWPPPSPL